MRNILKWKNNANKNINLVNRTNKFVNKIIKNVKIRMNNIKK